MNARKVKEIWEYIQGLLDINGDVIMLAFSTVIMLRIVMAMLGKAELNANEAAVYGSAVVAFAYSNKGKSK